MVCAAKAKQRRPREAEMKPGVRRLSAPKRSAIT